MNAATAAAARKAGDLRIDLVVPVVRFGVGPFAVDPIAQILGAPLESLLKPLLCGPVEHGKAKTGTAVNVFPLSLPDGEGVTLPLGHIGEAGVHNDRGLLLLTVPLGMAALVVGKLGGSIVRGPEGGPSADHRTRVARTWLMLQKGTRIGVPMGLLGEVGVVAV